MSELTLEGKQPARKRSLVSLGCALVRLAVVVKERLREKTEKRDQARLVIGTVVCWGAAVPGVALALATPMTFNAPSGLVSGAAFVAALFVVSFPVLAVLCPMLAWAAHALTRPRLARVLIWTPALPVIGSALFFAVSRFGCAGLIIQ